MAAPEVVATREGTNPHGDGRYIPILDGWRAVAIALVLLFHGFLNSELHGVWMKRIGAISGRTGALGVLVFFCISGYLITQRLLVESRRSGMFSVRNFYIKRAFRILPPLALYLLCIVVLWAAGLIHLVMRDCSAPLFLANYFQGSWYTSHFWSLSVEEHFYLFWPFCIVLVGWRRAMWVGVALIAAVAVWRPWELHRHFGAERARYLQHTDMRMDYILMGAIVALVVEFYPQTVGVLKRMGGTVGLLVLLGLLLLSSRPWSMDLRTLQAAILTLMVCASSMANAKLPRLLLANPVVLWVGKVSYSLYIWQQIFLAPHPGSFWSTAGALPWKYAAALIMASMSFQFVEKPFIRFGRSLLTKEPEPRVQREEDSVAISSAS